VDGVYSWPGPTMTKVVQNVHHIRKRQVHQRHMSDVVPTIAAQPTLLLGLTRYVQQLRIAQLRSGRRIHGRGRHIPFPTHHSRLSLREPPPRVTRAQPLRAERIHLMRLLALCLWRPDAATTTSADIGSRQGSHKREGGGGGGGGSRGPEQGF
jgi:hypothetical protein